MDQPTERIDQLLQRAHDARRVQNPTTLDATASLRLASDLSSNGYFGPAASILDIARKREKVHSTSWLRLTQKLTLCIYKDKEMPLEQRLGTAVALLNECDLLTTVDRETLGMAGAIYKRKWEHFGKRSDLEQSLNYYLRGFKTGIGDGYLAINAAFVFDLLAREVVHSGLREQAESYRQQAGTIRLAIVKALTEGDSGATSGWWMVATVVEAMVGLGDATGVRPWLARARDIQAAAWEKESTLRQLLALITRMDDAEKTSFTSLLREFFPAEIEALSDGPAGRFGLALSGGGFRAALFHLGVLARLAENDLLRHVEVISCVSGGSIVGAHYYLHLRHLLETKTDQEIQRADYVTLVQTMMATFLEGARANIRMLSLADLGTNLRVLFQPRYARSERIAELYDRYFFSRIPSAVPGRRILLRDLPILPKGHNSDHFVLSRDNWGRRHKVPHLIINATTLNTGHSWQFTPAGMGEMQSAHDSIGARCHLRGMYFDEAPPAQTDIPLSRAVAASSCVPVLFPPIQMHGMYPEKLVALVDGAMFDNQGVTSLLSQDCRSIVVSDGSGHIDALDRPPLGYLGVAGRSMGILQTRLRKAQHREMAALCRADVLEMSFLHLKQKLQGEVVNWVGGDTRIPDYETVPFHGQEPQKFTNNLTKEIQELLGKMRTDLDAFSDLESHALMFAGYQIAGEQTVRLQQNHSGPAATDPRWPFLGMERIMSGNDVAGSQRLLRHLKTGASRGGKWLRLSRLARLVGWIALFVMAFLSVLAIHYHRIRSVASIVGLTAFVVMACYVSLVLVALVSQLLMRSRSKESAQLILSQLAGDAASLLFVWPIALFDVLIVRPAYLQLGRLVFPKTDVDNEKNQNMNVHR